MFNKKMKTKYKLLKEKYAELKHSEVQGRKELVRLKEIERENELVNQLLEKGHIIGVEFNKYNKKQYVYLTDSSDIVTIMLRNIYSKHPHPRLYAKIYRDYQSEYRQCELIDIFAVDENSGNGTILLEYLMKQLKDREVSKVKGWLSNVDQDDFDKLERFYQKNGFTVNFNAKKTSGNISRNLE